MSLRYQVVHSPNNGKMFLLVTESRDILTRYREKLVYCEANEAMKQAAQKGCAVFTYFKVFKT